LKGFERVFSDQNVKHGENPSLREAALHNHRTRLVIRHSKTGNHQFYFSGALGH